MKKRVGILTSGGDCPGLNATIRGAAKALYQRFGDEVEIVGIQNGYDGLIKGEWREMQQYEFSGILTVGGTILGTKRTPFKMMTVVEDDKVDKVAAMKKTYKDAKLDCLLCLGGNGTHKTAKMLADAVESRRAYNIDCPALLLCGEKDHAGDVKVFNRKWAAGEKIPLVWIPGAGHNSNVDNPSFVNSKIEQLMVALK